LGVLGLSIQPEKEIDVSYDHILGCQMQCYSYYYYARFHAVPRAFAVFQNSHNLIQIVVGFLYGNIMRLLALTGFTLLFFNEESFKRGQHQSTENNFSVIIDRWEFYTNEVRYKGPHAVFPCELQDLPQVPSFYSFDWMVRNKDKLILRMVITMLLVIACIQFAQPLVELVSDLELMHTTSV